MYVGDQCDIKNTMLMSFVIKFIRRDQKQRRNGEASQPYVFPDKLDIKRHKCVFLFIMHLKIFKVQRASKG